MEDYRGLDRISRYLACLIFTSLVIGGLSAPVPSSYSMERDQPNAGWSVDIADDGAAELKLLFDPGLRHVILTDDYGERPVPPPLPPDAENPYVPNLEDNYY